MIPIKDQNPTTRPPVLTVLIIVACVSVFVGFQQRQGRERIPVGESSLDIPRDLSFELRRAAIPCEIFTNSPLGLSEVRQTFSNGDTDACIRSDIDSGPLLFPSKSVYLAILVSMFLHAGWLHLGGNMLFLWIFGNNIEDRLGLMGFALFYALGGVVATLAHVVVQPNSTVPVIGASGAIAAVMGAYLVWYPKATVLSYIPPIFVFPLAARWFLIIWFVLQFFTDANSRVAWVAHVAGFLFGMAAAFALRGSASNGQPRRSTM